MTAIRFYNAAAQAFSATGTTLQLIGTKTVDVGCAADVNGSAVTLNKSGVYHITFDVTYTAAAGDVDLTIYINGIPSAATVTQTAEASTVYTLHIETDVQQMCVCAGRDNVTLQISGAAGSVSYLTGSAIKVN